MSKTQKEINRKYHSRMEALVKEKREKEIFDSLAAGKNSYMRLDRLASSSFDKSWIEVIEGVIFDLGEIINNPRLNTKVEGHIVPVELARKTGAESVQHLSSHTQYIKEIDEYGNVIPSKIMTMINEDDIKTYDNRFVATFVRRLLLFVEKRYEFVSQFAVLRNEEVLMFKNKSIVDGAEVEIETKVKVSYPNEDEMGIKSNAYIERIAKIREYILYFYNSSFMKQLKTERDVRNPILQTNVIRKNPKYHHCFEVYKFIEGYDQLGVNYKVDENFSIFNEEELNELNRTLFANYITLKGKELSTNHKTYSKVYKPKILTSMDDEQFIYGPLLSGPISFVRVDEPYQAYLDSKLRKDLPLHPTKKEKEYYADEYKQKAENKEDLKQKNNLLKRKAKEQNAFEKSVEKVLTAREKARLELEAIEKRIIEAEENARLAEARRHIIAASLVEKEALELAKDRQELEKEQAALEEARKALEEEARRLREEREQLIAEAKEAEKEEQAEQEALAQEEQTKENPISEEPEEEIIYPEAIDEDEESNASQPKDASNNENAPQDEQPQEQSNNEESLNASEEQNQENENVPSQEEGQSINEEQPVEGDNNAQPDVVVVPNSAEGAEFAQAEGEDQQAQSEEQQSSEQATPQDEQSVANEEQQVQQVNQPVSDEEQVAAGDEQSSNQPEGQPADGEQQPASEEQSSLEEKDNQPQEQAESNAQPSNEETPIIVAPVAGGENAEEAQEQQPSNEEQSTEGENKEQPDVVVVPVNEGGTEPAQSEGEAQSSDEQQSSENDSNAQPDVVVVPVNEGGVESAQAEGEAQSAVESQPGEESSNEEKQPSEGENNEQPDVVVVPVVEEVPASETNDGNEAQQPEQAQLEENSSNEDVSMEQANDDGGHGPDVVIAPVIGNASESSSESSEEGENNEQSSNEDNESNNFEEGSLKTSDSNDEIPVIREGNIQEANQAPEGENGADNGKPQRKVGVIVHPQVSDDPIHGKFIIYNRKGFYISDDEYTRDRNKAKIFDEYHEVKKVAKRIGGKIVKIL